MVVATLTTPIPGSEPVTETVEILDKVGKTFWIVRPLGRECKFPVRAHRITRVHTERF